MVFSLQELIDLVVMTFAIGYIFSDFFKKEPEGDYDPLTYYNKPALWQSIKAGSIIAAPAVVLHELAHKFVAIGFGAQATVQAPYFWYAIVVVLKLMHFPLLFFVGGIVSHTPLPALQSAMVSLSGPLTNLLIWLACLAIVHFRLSKRKYFSYLVPIGRLKMVLFIFNILPLPGFDGFNFLTSLIRAF